MSSPDSVSFSGVLKSYPPGEKLEVSYCLHQELQSASRDWVGLFRVGWSSSRDYYTFEWAPLPDTASTEQNGTVVFAGRRLPPEDKHFYQFCYVSSDGRVRGASSPFQFTSSAALDRLEDLELVEVSEDSLMILQPKEVFPPEPKPDLVAQELVSVKECFTQLEAEKEVLVAKYEEESVLKVEQCGQLEEKIVDLERQLQAKRDSENRLMEKLEKERALTHELTAAKTGEETQVQLLRHQMVEMEATMAKQQQEEDTLRGAVADLEGISQGLEKRNGGLRGCNKDLKRQKEELAETVKRMSSDFVELQDVQVELMSQIGEKNAEIEQNMSTIDELSTRRAQEDEATREERDQLVQELTVAQQNIAELLGARCEGVVVHDTRTHANDNQVPPTLPATQVSMVDKSAYEALQQAYDNIEQMYHSCMDEAREMRLRFQARFDSSQVKVAEMTHRIEMCRVEYEAKCKEVIELQRQLQFPPTTAGGGAVGVVVVAVSADVATLQTKLRDMEENQEQVTKSWEAAIQELASRKEEIKQKVVAIAEMDEKMYNLGEALRMVEEEFSEFQDKHDQVMIEKRAKMDQLEADMAGKDAEIIEARSAMSAYAKDKAKLEHTVQQLREQLETLKQQANKSSDRACPVCGTKFPGRISQQDFEKHVQGHFAVV